MTDETDGAEDARDLLPVRMLNEFVYCPRLFHLMHVDGRWEENQYTLEGTEAHRRVDRVDQLLPPVGDSATVGGEDDDDPAPTIARSVSLSSSRLGITAKLDLVETEGDVAIPVDTKRGRVPKNADRSWAPERVQLMAQGLLLREHGYRCEEGVLYFAGSRTRVRIPFTPELEDETRTAIVRATAASSSETLPPPLEDSPKCNGCSLSGICLPDETAAMRLTRETVLDEDGIPVPESPPSGDADQERIRRLFPPRDASLPLYVQEQGALVGKRGGQLVVRKDGDELAKVRLKDVSQVVLMGGIGITAPTVHLLCDEGVPVVHVSRGHWFYGITSGISLRNSFDRVAQYRAAADPEKALAFARAIVYGKGANQRTMIGRNVHPRPEAAIRAMAILLRRGSSVSSMAELLGVEGGIAAHYFAHFGSLLKPRDFDATWDFKARNRRPPRDPVNALLSLGYAMLAKECTVALLAEGLDPWWGLYHQ
ncbi:MAG: CRISPR-associated endonuclease Cas1, partial [Gemmatimonadaceae bacterium]